MSTGTYSEDGMVGGFAGAWSLEETTPRRTAG